MPTDADLLRRFAASRDERAFAELVRRHVDPVYSAALRRVGGDRHLAEDVTQQVFAALARRASAVANHPHLTGWLYLATRNEAANTVRFERRRKAREQEAFTMQESASSQSAALDWHVVAPVIDQSLDQLNERDRTVILLRYFENRPFPDIGAALQLTEDAARMRVDRALEKLRVSLRRRGVTSTSTALGLVLTQHAVASAPSGLAATSAIAASAAAATTGTSALTAFELMISGKLASTVGALTLLIAASITIYEVHAARSAEAAVSTARTENLALSARLNTLENETSAIEREAEELTNRLRKQESDSAEAARLALKSQATGSPGETWDPEAEGNAFMERHPQVRQALHAWLDAQTNYRWSGFYVAEGFSAAEIAEFQRLHRQGGLGTSVALGSPTYQFLEGLNMSVQERSSRIREMLGEERYERYERYGRSMPAREIAAKVAAALAFSPAPLDASQFDALTKIISDHGLVRSSLGAGPQVDWQSIAREARSVFTSLEQLRVFDGLRAQSEFDQAVSKRERLK